jgi:hypothetical protein
MTRTPMPADVADASCSTSPSYTRTSVDDERPTTTSTCSPALASATIRSPIWSSSSSVPKRPQAAVPPTVRRAHPQGGHAVADGHALAVLAAGPGRAHLEVVADGIDELEHLGAVADEVALAQRLGDLAVLDQVRLGHPEHEVAGGGVDLAAAEVGHVHAVGGVGDDVVGSVVPLVRYRVGHADHRQVLGSSGGGRCPTAGRPSLRARIWSHM